MKLCDMKKRDELIEMAKERTTREGRMERPHCECNLLAYLDGYWSADARHMHRYIGTSTQPCLLCHMHLGAYRNSAWHLIRTRDRPSKLWKIPKSWAYVGFEDDGAHYETAVTFMKLVVRCTIEELEKKGVAEKISMFPWLELEDDPAMDTES
ncbi:hypothetical protein BOTBODRAFT_39550 [Botryobasidium botryosum FD-172 SS1]|uniref:Uncharacterized protein n=1 Tax=Botryobasidium botryosum (strain FD-172 SS1) TaxID=930990 RepID=A0A067LW49_BOTB1|nr:hypothetical protein BOTBODRAFT_39550 [Botryobasidium botryosum FD-172 SS1]